jgi:anhydro-N-acetylmuramic acid kinase
VTDSLHIGLMTGTSVDAVDAVLVDLSVTPPRLVAAISHPIPEPLERAIQALIASRGEGPARAAWNLDAALGDLYADAVEALLAYADIDRARVKAIGCHGQTVLHEPGGESSLTVQLGDANRVAARTGIATVADFRRLDIALGGEGAPLAPAFHAACLRPSNHRRVILNIGGIANVTVLDPAPTSPVLGFDTGPGNTLVDAWASRHLGERIDRDAHWARGGQVIPTLLEAMLSDGYFRRPLPKSTGRELFHVEWLEAHIDEQRAALDPRDVQRTLCELTAASATDAIEVHAGSAREVLVAGGGCHNPVIMGSLAERLASRRVDTTAAAGVDPDWLEAIAFAWIAARTMAGETGNLPSVTGARRPAVLGATYHGAG